MAAAIETPEKSATGKALLFINPHQPFFGPGQWYEGHLTSGEGWNLLGACFFGAPFPTLGHNESLAWSHTVNEPDIVDVYSIVPDPEDAARYRHGEERRRIATAAFPAFVLGLAFGTDLNRRYLGLPDDELAARVESELLRAGAVREEDGHIVAA